jgi:hypothetical protein
VWELPTRVPAIIVDGRSADPSRPGLGAPRGGHH